MIISKHLHSCLFIKENDISILIDPGEYTANEQALDLNSMEKLDYLLYTHEHADHFYLPLTKQIIEKFPDVKIYTNSAIVELLKKEEISARSENTEIIQILPIPHEKVFGIPRMCENIQISVFGKLTHPGDSFRFQLQTPVLALPVQAPWGDVTEAVGYALKAQPKVIIPIHDWHWKDSVQDSLYGRLKDFFAANDITFLPLKTGEETSV